jgi:hypothetical protein
VHTTTGSIVKHAKHVSQFHPLFQFIDLGLNLHAKTIQRKITQKSFEEHEKLQSIKIAQTFLKLIMTILLNHM